MPKTQHQLVTTAAAARRLRVSTRTIARLVESDTLVPAIKTPGLRGAFLFAESDVARLERDRAERVA